jgi:hypothetical protein
VLSAGGDFSGAADAQFFTPITAPPFSQVPVIGTCDAYTGSTPTARPNYSIGNFLQLSTGGSSLQLALQPDQSYLAAPLAESAVPTWSSYSLLGGIDPDGCPLEYPGVISGTAPLQLDESVLSPRLLHCPSPVASPPLDSYQCWFRDQDPNYPGLEGGTIEWTPGTTPSGNVVDGLIFTMSHYDTTGPISSWAPSSMPGLICHQLDSAGSIWVDPSFFSSPPVGVGMMEGAYIMNVIRYRTSATQDQRSGATVYGTFIDAQSVNLWLLQTATRCLNIPSQLCSQ